MPKENRELVKKEECFKIYVENTCLGDDLCQ